MKYYSQYLSYDLFELQHSLSGLSKTNRWVKLADRLPRYKIEKEYNKRHDEQFFNMLTLMGQNKKDYRQKNSSTHQDAALFINVSTRNPAHIFPD